MLWDGGQLLDASAGYPDNDALVAGLLGFRPTRHAPLSSEATLYEPPGALADLGDLGDLGDEPDDEDGDA
jgi:hypothetical protein